MTSLLYSSGSLIWYNSALAIDDTDLCDCVCGEEVACPDKCPVASVTFNGTAGSVYTGSASQYCKGAPIVDAYPDEVGEANGTIWYFYDDDNCTSFSKHLYFWCGDSGTVYLLECPDDEITSTDLNEYLCDDEGITDLGGGSFQVTIAACDGGDMDVAWSN